MNAISGSISVQFHPGRIFPTDTAGGFEITEELIEFVDRVVVLFQERYSQVEVDWEFEDGVKPNTFEVHEADAEWHAGIIRAMANAIDDAERARKR